MAGKILVLELSALAVPVLVLGMWGLDWARTERPYPLAERKGTTYAGSAECKACHAENHRSWSATYHSRMTQRAGPESILPEIGAPLELRFGEVSVVLRREGERTFVRLPWLDGQEREMPLLYTIGSRRMQQYAVQDRDQIWRIPVFYSVEEQRFRHINEAFFRLRSAGVESFVKGYSLWNPNCIFCHNTRPSPGYDPQTKTYASEVAELGIACEECHGPGALHARLERNPLRRILARVLGGSDPAITHPGKLEALRSTQVCGQCHGQRLPRPLERITELMRHGDPYAAGEDLYAYYSPLQLGDELESYRQFYLRFWKDGSPRLTAYELQGLTSSKCFQKSGTMSCLSCHRGHGGDPRGMIEPAMRTDAACTGCHKAYQERTQAERHSRHRLESASCRDCHMPEVVYGVLTLHPTHLIRSPEPERTVRHGQPEACNLCHLDKSVNWSVRERLRLWKGGGVEGSAELEVPEIVRGMAAGDAVYRTVLAYHAGKRRLQGFDGVLLAGLQDPYHTVRRVAAQALEAIRGQRLASEEAWEIKLNAEGIAVPELLRSLRANAPPEEPFEFGE